MDTAATTPLEGSFLIVDDDEMLRTRLARAVESRGFSASTAADYEEGVSVLKRFRPEYAVVDLNMPGKNGLDFLQALQQLSPHTRAVMVTGFGSIPTAVEAMRLGAYNYLAKPADADQIMAALSLVEGDVKRNSKPRYRPQTLAESEWEHIHRVLSDCGENISEAARQLGIPRRTLQRKLKKRAP